MRVDEPKTTWVWIENAAVCAACSSMRDGVMCAENGKRYLTNALTVNGCPLDLHDSRPPSTMLKDEYAEAGYPAFVIPKPSRLTLSWIVGSLGMRRRAAVAALLRRPHVIVLVKIIAALLDRCSAPLTVITGRMDQCITCEHRKRSWRGWFDRCLKCGCVLRWKTRLALEGCPVGKWSRVEPERCDGFIARLYPVSRKPCNCSRRKTASEEA